MISIGVIFEIITLICLAFICYFCFFNPKPIMTKEEKKEDIFRKRTKYKKAGFVFLLILSFQLFRVIIIFTDK